MLLDAARKEKYFRMSGEHRPPTAGAPSQQGLYFGPARIRLPPGWTQHYAPQGQPYFFHATSGHSTHVHPDTFMGPPPQAPPVGLPASKPKKEKPKVKDTIPGAPGWLRVITNFGNVFYAHPETRRSEWTVPDEIAEAVQELEAGRAPQEESPDEDAAGSPKDVLEGIRGHTLTPSQHVGELPGRSPESNGAQPREVPTDGKRKRDVTPTGEEPGIDAADLISSGADAVEDDEGEGSEGVADDRDANDSQNGKRPRIDASRSAPVGVNGADDDETEWQCQIAAGMAAEAAAREDGDAREIAADGTASRPAPPTAPPQPPLPSVPAAFRAPPPPGEGCSGPPPGFQVAASIPPKLSLEEGRALFMHMLTMLNGTSSEVNPMAPWDKELPKFVHRSEYSALSNLRDRQDAFNDWCKARLRGKREQKKVVQGSSSAGKSRSREGTSEQSHKEARISSPTSSAAKMYNKLLEDHVKSTRTRFDDFRKEFKKDRRFYAFGRDDREREKVFRAYLRDLGEKKRLAAEAAEQDFVGLLESRFKGKRRGNEGSNWAELSDSELKGGVWKDLKQEDDLDKQSAYEKVGSSSRRAELFVQWARGQATEGQGAPVANSAQHASTTPTAATDDKQQRRERALREREEQARRHQDEVRRTNSRALGQASREGGVIRFTELLVDAVRDPAMSWDDFAHANKGDARFECHGLEFSRKREMFEKHLDTLVEKKRNQLDGLFQKYAPELEADAEVVIPLTLDDAEYERVRMGHFVRFLQGQRGGHHEGRGSSNEEASGIRAEFDRWQRSREAAARKDFEEMLRENSFVEFWGRIKYEAAQKEAQGERGAAIEAAAKAALAQNQAVGDLSNLHGVGNAVPTEDDDGGDASSLREMADRVDLEEMHAVLRSDARYRAWKHRPGLRDQWLRDHVATLGARKMTYWDKSGGTDGR